MTRLVRPWHFLAASIPLFLLWEFAVRQPWLTFVAHLFATTALVFGLQVDVLAVADGSIRFAYAGAEWTDRFGLTGINIVAFFSLVLATGGVTRAQRGRMLLLGGLVVLGTQVLGLWSDIVHVHLSSTRAGAAFANGLRALLTGLGTFLFPFLVWLYFVRRRLPLPRARRKRS